MRIVLISAYGLPHIGGIEVIVDELASTLANQGNEVTHLTSTAGCERGAREVPYRIRRVPAINTLERRLGVPYPLFSPVLFSALKHEIARADVVHAHGFIYPGTVVASLLASRAKPRPALVLTEHVGHVPYASPALNALERLAIRTLGRQVLRNADVVVTYNDRVSDQLGSLWPAVDRKTILNGVDHQLFHPATPEERNRLRAELNWDERPRALFVGRPVAKKGYPTALEAAEQAQSDIALAVAGSDEVPSSPGVRAEALGPLSRHRLAEVYRASDVLLVPSRGEGFPLVVQEASASGLPVLLADDPGYAPNLAGARDGIRIIRERSAFGPALTELLDDRDAYRRACNAAAAHAKSAFSWSRAAKEHEQLYRRLLAKRDQP